MKTPARYAAAALLAALCAGPAAAEDGGEALFAAPEAKSATKQAAPACTPEFVVREPETEGMRDIYDARWCGPDAIVYMTSNGTYMKPDPFMVWVDLATGERRSIASGRVNVDEMEEIDSVASSFGCVADGSWVYYLIPNTFNTEPRAEIKGWSVADGSTTSYEVPQGLWRVLPSPDGRTLLSIAPKYDIFPEVEVIGKLEQPPYWTLVRLTADAQRASEIAWLPNSKSISFKFSFRSSGQNTSTVFSMALREAEAVAIPLADVTLPPSPPANEEGDLLGGFFVSDHSWERARTELRYCRIAESKRFCKTVANLPDDDDGNSVEWAISFAARPGDATLFFGTRGCKKGTDACGEGGVYRHDANSGESFRIAWGQLMGGLSPDGRRLIYRSEPFTLNVLNLDDPATRTCGTSVAAGKE